MLVVEHQTDDGFKGDSIMYMDVVELRGFARLYKKKPSYFLGE